MKTKQVILISSIAAAAVFTLNSCILSLGGTVSTTTTTTTQISALSQHLISAAQARILSAEYTEKNYRLVNIGKDRAETKEVFYDIEVLEDYIKYVKTQAGKKGLKNVGITIAFGQYPKTGMFDSRLKENYKGQQTVYLKPTVKSLGSGKVGIGGYTPESNADGIEEISAFDFGQLTPPER